ncbi:MAG: glycoside hydrolase family 99-like domain-containing protein, partial [Hydrogenovibrio sp.]|uniref:glycoside hydrolase family 99-like domain-containing protein n=1 Tax=Hydrogenovibrio sp. TaxID=2065821 RepID=UPI0028709671
ESLQKTIEIERQSIQSEYEKKLESSQNEIERLKSQQSECQDLLKSRWHFRFFKRTIKSNSKEFKSTLNRTKNKLKAFCQSKPKLVPVCKKIYHFIKPAISNSNTGQTVTSLAKPEDSKNWVQTVLSKPSEFFLSKDACPTPNWKHHSHKVFAFYLPQFHAFKENDQWWGEGFTEWTNVSKATPQFVGHEQPRLPSDLGFYDLSHTKTMYQQAQLAKKAGIDAFCVYYYWFAGKSLMETPLENWLNEPQLDFPMFLCWANENWTRRWDGNDKEVLIAQDHTPEDDLAFIKHISPYLLDKRYHRIDNKPMLVLYYPSLLPDVKETGERWREYMRTHHQTELFLLVVQSRDNVNPNEIGFDGAIEFPPVGIEAAENKTNLQIIHPEFANHVYDYEQTVRNILTEKDPAPPYFRARGVMPGWDNTARRSHSGNVFIKQTPYLYSKWLHDAILNLRWTQPENQQMVFINAWNEWAEGTYLEPDRRNGHAYLCATQKAVSHWNDHAIELLQKGEQQHSHALIIHAYYPSMLQEIHDLHQSNKLPLDIWITIPDPAALSQVNALWPTARVYVTPNIGRDVAPFVSVLPDLLEHEYSAVLKLHTKKSIHRKDGANWRAFLFNELMPQDSEKASTMVDHFVKNEAIGMISATGHAPAIKYFWGSNKKWLSRLSKKYGHTDVTGEEAFAAGTMFWFKPRVFEPLTLNPIRLGDFFYDDPVEIDGSLAHALERYFGCFVEQKNLKLIDASEMMFGKSEYSSNKWSPYLGF